MIGLVAFGALAFVIGVVRTVLRNRRTGRAREMEEAAGRLAAQDRAELAGRTRP